MADLKYPFVTYPSPEGGYVAEIPSLPGCLAQGESINETLEELEVVERLWLEAAERKGVKYPHVPLAVEHVKELLAA
jgi:predicted RNase H-like HicB family nuclease